MSSRPGWMKLSFENNYSNLLRVFPASGKANQHPANTKKAHPNTQITGYRKGWSLQNFQKYYTRVGFSYFLPKTNYCTSLSLCIIRDKC